MENTIILITSNGIGTADAPLQQILIAKYLELLRNNNDLPAAICFYTDGVRLVCEGSQVLDQLQDLETKGVRLLVCSTCLEYFNLTNHVRAGIVGGMGDILDAQIRAEKVITL
jgi:intracellular sulfur oxidation DsrE/DsrF family protein